MSCVWVCLCVSQPAWQRVLVVSIYRILYIHIYIYIYSKYGNVVPQHPISWNKPLNATHCRLVKSQTSALFRLRSLLSSVNIVVTAGLHPPPAASHAPAAHSPTWPRRRSTSKSPVTTWLVEALCCLLLPSSILTSASKHVSRDTRWQQALARLISLAPVEHAVWRFWPTSWPRAAHVMSRDDRGLVAKGDKRRMTQGDCVALLVTDWLTRSRVYKWFTNVQVWWRRRSSWCYSHLIVWNAGRRLLTSGRYSRAWPFVLC